MLEARFASLNPFMQHMFLKLHDIEDPKKKAFILETLRREFRDSRMPIPCKLVGIHDALENNFSWICPKNIFDESSVPRHDYKGYSKLIWTEFISLLKRLLQLILMLLL
jgi:hypothetical protein